MTDNKLFKPSDSLAQQKLGLTKSLREKLQQMKTSLKTTLLLDLSGSMHDYIDGNKSKRDALEDIVRKLPSGLRKFAFSNHCEEIKDNSFPAMGGSTALDRAFVTIKQAGINDIILITDGEPDSPKSALEESKGLKIEIIYVGPMPRPYFLEELAHASGANFTSVDMLEFGSVELLENKIKGLLGS